MPGFATFHEEGIRVGAGATIDAWKARAESEGLAQSIEFLGFRRDVQKVLGACDILVSPARYEAYGLNVHEALCLGLPALVTRDAGEPIAGGAP